ncbi:MAG: FecR family protein [Bacteroidetes bacterium]|nr:FecR family protein [Bacteroidota bacterium]
MTKDQYILLFEKYHYGLCTNEEIDILKHYQDAFELKDMQWLDDMGDKTETEASIYTKIEKDLKPAKTAAVRRFPVWYKIIAAAILVFIIAGIYTFIAHQKINQTPVISNVPNKIINDAAPGGNRAILTLANGSIINLDSAQKGIIAKQGNTAITKTADGKIVYNIINASQTSIAYNLLSTPRGGQYQLMLPDGSKVWLNAASSIRYPSEFSGKERNVEVTGEVYFEVAKNPAMPFTVNVNNMTVKVMGTHFNINAYSNEPNIKTTLIEGSIKIGTDKDSAILKPGQQAQISKASPIKVFNNADMDEVLAWKNGFIAFKSADIETIMRQLSRWYDVDVVYNGKISERNFTGEISRNENLSEVLKILQASNIHFKIENKKIIVMP